MRDMTYSLIIHKHNCDPSYILGLKKWEDVVNHLKFNLPYLVTNVEVYKYSSDYKTLASKCVTMSNMYNIVTSPTDKILYH